MYQQAQLSWNPEQTPEWFGCILAICLVAQESEGRSGRAPRPLFAYLCRPQRRLVLHLRRVQPPPRYRGKPLHGPAGRNALILQDMALTLVVRAVVAAGRNALNIQDMALTLVVGRGRRWRRRWWRLRTRAARVLPLPWRPLLPLMAVMAVVLVVVLVVVTAVEVSE